MSPAVNESNVKHYRHTKAITDFHEFPGRPHYTVVQEGWEEVTDHALEWGSASWKTGWAESMHPTSEKRRSLRFVKKGLKKGARPS